MGFYALQKASLHKMPVSGILWLNVTKPLFRGRELNLSLDDSSSIWLHQSKLWDRGAAEVSLQAPLFDEFTKNQVLLGQECIYKEYVRF